MVLLADSKLGAQVDQWLERLPDREREVVERRFGLHGFRSQTLAEVGTDLGVTRERVRQIQIQALRRLRKISQSDGVTDSRQERAVAQDGPFSFSAVAIVIAARLGLPRLCGSLASAPEPPP